MKPVVAMLRQRGVRRIIYLDDMLIMAESASLVLLHAASALNLLESLGFVINYKMSQLTPSQQIEFLGFLIDSVALSLLLPGEKLRKIAKNQKTMPKITKFRRGLKTRIIKIPGPPNFFHSGSFPSSSLLSTASEIKESQLEHPSVLRCNNSSGLPSEGGTGLVARLPSSMEWKSAIPEFCRPSDRNRCVPQGLGGGGGVCEGVSTVGPWYTEEQRFHINCLELLAGSFAIKTFCKNKVVGHVKLLMDNLLAVAYINKMGGTHSKL